MKIYRNLIPMKLTYTADLIKSVHKNKIGNIKKAEALVNKDSGGVLRQAQFDALVTFIIYTSCDIYCSSILPIYLRKGFLEELPGAMNRYAVQHHNNSSFKYFLDLAAKDFGNVENISTEKRNHKMTNIRTGASYDVNERKAKMQIAYKKRTQQL